MGKIIEKRISIFGDSITWGASDKERGGWVARLRHYFENEEGFDVDVYNLGVSGDSSADLLKRFEVECEARNRHPQTILFAIGINDAQYIGTPDNRKVSLDDFEMNILKLVEKAKSFSCEIVFIGLTRVDEKKTMPVQWCDDKYYSNAIISEYDAVLKKIAADQGMPMIDMSDLISDEDLKDGLHPGPDGHERMFLRVRDFLVNEYWS